jgi:Short C-terminal domain
MMNKPDRLERLERLARLRDQGALSANEFEAQKAALFGTTAAAGAGRLPIIATILAALLLIGAGGGYWMLRAPSRPAQGNVAAAARPANSARPAAAQSAAAAIPRAASAAMGEPLLGNCQMDSCSYSRLVRRETVRESPVGRLLRVTLLGGTQGEAGDDGPDGDAPIMWDREPHDVFIFCSTRLPAVMMRVAGQRTLQTDLIDLGGRDAISDVLISSANLYMDVCHGLRDRDLSEESAGLGYRPIPRALLDGRIAIERPEEIFGFAR